MTKHIDDKKLDQFLKRNASAVPPAPLGEKERIWRAIEAEASQAPFWKTWLRHLHFGLPELRVALPVAAAFALTLTVLIAQKLRKDAETDKILAAALAYQIEEIEGQEGIF